MSEVAGGLHATLWALECAYWEDVDFNGGALAPSFYTRDAVFDIGLEGATFIGRKAIEGFYERRRASGERTSAHLVHNFVVEPKGAGVAQTRSMIVLYADSGAAPLSWRPPALIARCTVDVEWRDPSVPLFVSER
jgi:hypothetical protein